jgi:heptaprenyl diphosphate synthase/octaprenyl-diphosphate synthase
MATITENLSVDSLEENLQEVEDLLKESLCGANTSIQKDLIKLIVSGGKRIRPRITLLTGRIFGVGHCQLLRVATAIEMMHTASLIHDDISDKTLLRRGVETINANWPTSTSVLAGDYVLTKAFRLILTTGSITLIKLFTKALDQMVSGELRYQTGQSKIPDKKVYFDWIGSKTAALFELAASAPAHIHPVDTSLIKALCRFGYQTGMAFQVVDDILDFTGSELKYGKPVGNDLRQGTLTLPALLYLDIHPADRDLQLIIRGKKLEDKAYKKLLERIGSSSVIDASLDWAHAFINSGLNALSNLPDVPERDCLSAMVKSIVPLK